MPNSTCHRLASDYLIVAKQRRAETRESACAVVARRFAFKINCGAVAPVPPSLTHKGEPELGHSFNIRLGDARKNSSAIFLLGMTKLNLSLAGIGAPNCTLFSSLEALLAVPTGANGAASLRLPIPLDTRLIGAQFFNQFIVIDSGANSFGMAFTDGGEAKIGG